MISVKLKAAQAFVRFNKLDRISHAVSKKRLGIVASVRMSFGLYNNTSEIDLLISALDRCRQLFIE